MSFMVQGLTLNLLLFFFALLLLGGNWSLAFGIAVKLSIIKLMYLLSLHAFPPCFTTPHFMSMWTSTDWWSLWSMNPSWWLTSNACRHFHHTLNLPLRYFVPWHQNLNSFSRIWCSCCPLLSLFPIVLDLLAAIVANF